MSEKDPENEPSDDDLTDFEDAVSAQDEGTIQLICPICGAQRFEQIRLFGKNQLLWDTHKPTKLEDRVAKFVGAKRVTSYRCRRCDYIVLFARS